VSLLGPSTDYSDKDFDALRARLRSLIQTAFPQWTSQRVANFGNVLIESFAFVGDVVTKYQDNQAAEAFWGRVLQRKNIINLGKLIAFTPRGNTASQVVESLSLVAPVAGDTVIPAGTIVRTEKVDAPVKFRLLADSPPILAGLTGPVEVLAENSELREELFTATGLPNQSVQLAGTPFLDGSLELSAANGDYTVVDTLLDSGPTDRHVVIVVDQNDRATLRFGNGTAGQVPTGTITATYAIGGGSAGMVDAGKVSRIDGSFTDELGNPVIVVATNAERSTVALDRMTVEEMRLAGPQSLRVLTRTVAREDYEINALRVPGVARALELTSDQDESIPENTGILFVVPVGGGAPTTLLKDAVLEMVTVTYPRTVTFEQLVQDPNYLTVDVAARVYFKKGASKTVAAAAIRDRLARAFAIQPSPDDSDITVGIDFGFNLVGPEGETPSIAWSDVENVVRDTDGVRKIDPGALGFLLNGARADVAILLRQFPVLGAVTIIDADTELPL